MITLQEIDSVREEIVRAAELHEGGMKIRPLLAVDPVWFARIQKETLRMIEALPASDVTSPAHPTNWVNPYGRATQHSLLNRSGLTDDITGLDESTAGKSFTAPQYPAIAELYQCFENHAMNFRLNGMMSHSGLNPHEEDIIHGSGRIRVRLHLPVFTNPGVSALLDEERFHMRAGFIYFFNNGCVHSADNRGCEARYHFVWDVWLDQWAFEHLFSGDPSQTPHPQLQKVPGEFVAEELASSWPESCPEYITYKRQNGFTVFRKNDAGEYERVESAAPHAPETPLSRQPVPPVDIFGYIDQPANPYRTRAGGEIQVSGWAAGTRKGSPVRTIRVSIGGRPVATVRSFTARPEVAAIFDRVDFLDTGWSTLCPVPPLAPGHHEITATAEDAGGRQATLPPVAIEIEG